jgi:hypothetical protein
MNASLKKHEPQAQLGAFSKVSTFVLRGMVSSLCSGLLNEKSF